MTSSGPVDYAKTYFLHPTLTIIHRNPDYSALKNSKSDPKANNSRVTSDLGGGGHVHLGLFLTPHEYSMIFGVPYVRPLHLCPVDISNETSQY